MSDSAATATHRDAIVPAVIVLAAGASSRMGRSKLLLPWAGRTVIAHLVETWHAIGAHHVAVVCAADDLELAVELDRIGVAPAHRIENPHPARGMFSSIQCAARWDKWNATITHWAIVLGDQPHLRRSTLQTLIHFASSHPEKICQPARRTPSTGGLRPRHPVILPRHFFQMLAGSPQQTLRDFLSSMNSDIALIEIDDPGLDLDLDRPADYEQALRLHPGA